MNFVNKLNQYNILCSLILERYNIFTNILAKGMATMFYKIVMLAILQFGLDCNANAGEVTVSAASSLTDAFNEVALAFAKKNPETKVSFNFAASGALLQQLANGAPVDVVAFADLETMDNAQSKDLVKASERKIFASNSLVVITPIDSKLILNQLNDLTNAAFKRIAIGNPASVPAGRYAKMLLQAASIWESLGPKFIQTQNARQALDYVVRGEVDAGIVYATDAAILHDKVRIALDLTAQKTIAIKYPIAVTTTSRRAMESKSFVDFVVSADGQIILQKFGFKKP